MAGPSRGDDADDRCDRAPDGPVPPHEEPTPAPDDAAPAPAGEPHTTPPDASSRLDDATVAARWAELTSAFGELRMPADPRADAGPGPAGPGTTPVRPAADPGPRDYSPPETDEDETYQPPEPEPLTHADPVVTLGWVAVVGSVVLGFVLAVVWRPVPDGVLGILALVLLAGVGLLLWRMPSRRDHDDRSDGAVV